MTRATPSKLKHLEASIATRGLRVTPQRLQIARHILAKHRHFTAEDVIAWASRRKLKLSRATVYNTLNEFVAVGLLKSFFSSKDDKLIFDSNTTKHFHFLNTATNEMFDIDPALCVLNTDALKGFLVEETEILFRGRRVAQIPKGRG